MDPRRARDPRLAARADPRLQQRQPSGSPAPAPPPPQPVPQYQNQWPENGVTNYSTPPPSLSGGVPGMPPPTTSLQLETLPHSDMQPSAGPSSTYKPRPLFCVVCASNQVRTTLSFEFAIKSLSSESFHGGALCIVVRPHNLLGEYPTDESKVKQVTGSSLLVQDQLYVCPDLQ